MAGRRADGARPGAAQGDGQITAALALERAQAQIAGRVVWSDVSITIAAGEFTAVLGPNGSGKTTLLRVLLGELALSAGSVSVLGQRPGASNRSLGYLPQRRHFDANARIRGIDLVRLGLDGTRWGLPLRRSGRERVEQVLALVGAGEYARRPIGQLSGGEQQRLLVAHDVNPLLSYLDGVVYFGAGRAVVGTPSEVITAQTLSRLYGVPIEVLEASDGRLVVVGLPEAPAHHSDRHEHV